MTHTHRSISTDPTDSIDYEMVVVSNRQPYRHEYDSDGRESSLVVECPTGGLTAGLDPTLCRLEGTWVAWGDGEADADVTDRTDCVRVPPDDPSYTLRRVWLESDEVDGYYRGYSNRVLWPLCHGLVSKVSVTRASWEAYRRVNDRFAEAAIEQAETDSAIWFQDYHLALAPERVRETLGEEATLAHFWHIPWPGWESFRICPHRREILSGLLANDLVGFHVPRYVANFLLCADATLPEATVDWESHRVRYRGRTTDVRAFPMGVDADTMQEICDGTTAADWTSFARNHDVPTDGTIATGVERLDYTKGIPQRLAALERLWETDGEWRGELTYVQKGSESRSSIPEYRALQETVRTEIDRINDRFATEDWQPIVSIDDHLPNADLCTLYANSDIALVSPVVDGMNLVCQEYVAAQTDDDGVLVLSELAGAHDLLGEFALTINPYDPDGFTETIRRGLTMNDDERRQRMRRLRQLVHGHDIQSWVTDVLAAIEETRRTSATYHSRVSPP